MSYSQFRVFQFGVNSNQHHYLVVLNYIEQLLKDIVYHNQVLVLV